MERPESLPENSEDIEEEFDLETIEEDLERFQQDPVVREALSKGVDLRQYALQVDSELKALQVASIPEYILQAPKTAKLYEEINECDKLLADMEKILLGFQNDLGGISDEIKHLQTESLAMSTKLKNRRAVKDHLHRFLSNLVVPDSLIVGICQHEVNETYLRYLRSLDQKIQFARDQEPFEEEFPPPCDTAAVQDVEPQLERLRLKAVSRVRDFLLNKINELRNKQTNIGMIQQNVFLKFSYFIKFLERNAPAVHEEIRATYIETMAAVLAKTFRAYYTNLLKMKKPTSPADDVVGAKRTFINQVYSRRGAEHNAKPITFLSNQPNSPISSIFSTPPEFDEQVDKKPLNILYEREKQLGHPEAPPIVIHAAQQEGSSFYFESIFRTVQCHLMNSVTSEYLFTLEFFEAKTRDVFNQIFAKTLSLCLEYLENELYNCNDIITILLMIKTTQAHQLIMERRKIPCLDGYFDHINMMLWPQFKKVFNAHLRSLQNPDPASVGPSRLQAHYISKRYAEFASIVYALSASLRTADGMLSTNMELLKSAYLNTLNCICKRGYETRVLLSKKARSAFLSNNYECVIHTMRNSNYTLDVKLLQFFEDTMKQEISIYIEEELIECYGRIVRFVKKEEENIQQHGKPQTDESELVSIAKEFSNTWRSGLELLNSSVMTYFSDYGNSREILKQTLTQLLLYYTRFQDIAKAHYDMKTVNSFVQIATIMEEIKRFSRQD